MIGGAKPHSRALGSDFTLDEEDSDTLRAACLEEHPNEAPRFAAAERPTPG